MPTSARNYTSEHFFLNLDGLECGFLRSVEGGGISADVIQEQVGTDYFVKKHIGSPKYEDLLLQIDLSMDKRVYEWIATLWNGKYARKDATIFVADDNMQVKAQSELFNVMLTEVTIPAMDGSSKDPCYITLRLSPEYSRYKKASGKLPSGVGRRKQKSWLPSNFKLEIDGLDATRVSKVDAFTIKQTLVTHPIGEMREYQREPSKLEFPNLKITLAENYAKTWIDWHEDFVIKGNSSDSQEKNGSLTFLSPNLTSELARIKFFNLGIFRLAPEKAQAQSDQIKRMAAELYCERMDFVF
jgi:phage tail-like protein